MSDEKMTKIIDEEMTKLNEAKKDTHRPSCAVITVRDPDGGRDFHGQEGGTLEIRTESRNYDFEVVLVDAAGSPFLGPEHGSITEPVVFEIPMDSNGEYVVRVMHRHKCPEKHSSPPHPDVHLFNVHTCPGCTP